MLVFLTSTGCLSLTSFYYSTACFYCLNNVYIFDFPSLLSKLLRISSVIVHFFTHTFLFHWLWFWSMLFYFKQYFLMPMFLCSIGCFSSMSFHKLSTLVSCYPSFSVSLILILNNVFFLFYQDQKGFPDELFAVKMYALTTEVPKKVHRTRSKTKSNRPGIIMWSTCLMGLSICQKPIFHVVFS
jgi:hypothetical protein